MAYTKSGSPFLYDESSDDVVGVKDRDGGESLFLKLVGNEVQAGNGAQTVILPEIANYSALRAYSGPQTAYYVRGVASLFDGGAGVFRVDASDTTSADNGGTILVDAAGRRWKREFSGAVNAAWFGGGAAFASTVAYATSGARKIAVTAGTLSLTGLSTISVSGSLIIEGEGHGSVIDCGGVSPFALTTGASITLRNVRVTNYGTLIAISSTNSHPLISAVGCKFDTGGAVLSDGCGDITRLVFADNELETISADRVLYASAYIKSALIRGNKIDGVTSATSSLQVFRLGKTQIADAPLTGDYTITGNQIKNLTANGNAAGEMHAVIAWGRRGVICGNTIKNIDRPLARQSGGVEGIYTKLRGGIVGWNTMEDAGFAEGNKGAFINIKGAADADSVGSNDPAGGPFIVVGNICYCTDANARNGIRIEADNFLCATNEIHAPSGTAGIIVSWPDPAAKNGRVENNLIAKPSSTHGIWLNTVGTGLSVRHNTIGARTVAAAGGESGIQQSDANRTSGAVDHLNISDNDIDATNCEYGVYMLHTSRNATNLSINRNKIKGGTYGIRTLSATYLLSGACNDNEMRGTGLAFRDKATSTLRFRGNTLDDGPADGWAAAPTTGTWKLGEIAYKATPAASGYLGWICTTAGTPGTWKEFGAIAA